jgi:hypothetical protein
MILAHPRSAGPALASGLTDYGELVSISSNHLVLQTIYVKLLQEDLVRLLPPDLATHLEEIYNLNLARNRRMLTQARRINDILTAGGITPVFIKGMGNMVDSLYADPGMRLMQDIDILTGPADMEKAAGLLLADGYETHGGPPGTGTMKHFPPVYKKGEPAIVDVHRWPVNIQYSRHFDFARADMHKRPAYGEPDMMVMSDVHKIRLNFIHSQLVHWGHQRALPFMRDLYDLHLLSGREDVAAVLSATGPLRGKAAGYLRVMYSTFDVQKELPAELRGRGKLYSARHRITLDNPRAGRFAYNILRAWRLYLEIPVRCLFDKNYRQYAMARLRDPRWYMRTLGMGKVNRR